MLGVRVAEFEDLNAMQLRGAREDFWRGRGWKQRAKVGCRTAIVLQRGTYQMAAVRIRCDAFKPVAAWNENGRNLPSLFAKVSSKLSESCSPSSICTLRHERSETRDKRQDPDMLLVSQPVPRPNHPSVHP